MIDAISEAEGYSCALYPIPYGQGRKPGMNTKKLSGIREMGSLVLATALYWIVSKNCSDLSREKKNCSVLGSIWPSAQSFDPRGSRTACEACQNAKRMRHGVHFFS